MHGINIILGAVLTIIMTTVTSTFTVLKEHCILKPPLFLAISVSKPHYYGISVTYEYHNNYIVMMLIMDQQQQLQTFKPLVFLSSYLTSH